MGWNESPGGGGKDPWGRGGGNEGPPDLDEMVRKLQQGLGGLFGRRPAATLGNNGSASAWLLIFFVVMAWLAYDITYTINEQERGIVLRFGQYVTTLQPGLNFRLPRPVEDVLMVNVGQGRSITHKAIMLTRDENIVDVELAVQWRIKDPTAYRFNVVSPEATLHQATETAVREVIGKSELDFVLTEGRSQIAQSQQKLIQQIMDDYNTGILILSAEMQSAKPPDDVKAAFDDAIKAREDEQRLVNEAEAYRNDIIPKARGSAARLREEANAYKARVISRSEGDASRFDQLRVEYERAPEVTRQRLYLDSMESVLTNTNKVLLDAKSNSNLMYIPLDRLFEQNAPGKNSPQLENIKPRESDATAGEDAELRNTDRIRETR